MNNFKKYNLFVGWAVFLVAAIVYLMTAEPTASLWDCAEFIATSYKLEVGHPPGAPLFMMLSRFFAIFAPSPQSVALMVNMMSCLASAFTILFLFWTITHLACKAVAKGVNELSNSQVWAVIGAGAIGALAYAFTDTFWFSAVEGEVYALSSFFTAIVFWAIFKWENVADQPHADRWLVLIAYLMGLSIGVHLLNLLAIPAIVFVYYFKKNPTISRWGILKATLFSFLLLLIVMGIIPSVIQFGASFDRLFVNSFGLPANSGMLFYIFVLFVLLGVGIWISHKKGKVLVNTALLFVTVLLIGYGSYASVVIRASVNPPMNSNNPNNPYALISLLNRDQYGSNPLIKGQYYSSPASDYKEKTTYYLTETGKYIPVSNVVGVKYPAEFTYFFPRMHSDKPDHVAAYKYWGQVKGKPVQYGQETITVPTFGENLRFFFAYQLNFMYWRYFLWNFVGRQSDIQSTGSPLNGNWLSGITPIDELYLGPQDNLPSETAQNKGRNNYYFLPFILGLAGLFYQMSRDGKNFSVVVWLFFMTGIAIILYLNSTPNEPRERDYAYAGSFYAFAIWIGLGVLSVYQFFQKYLKKGVLAPVLTLVICASVPGILIAQNWDDHDRSNRYVTRDFGANYLNTTLPNAIIMNYGDNDTFPLWYAQEVEGVRTDVRVMNMSYLGAEWYIDEMKLKANESEPVPFSLPQAKYLGTNTFLSVHPVFKETITVQEAIEFIKSDDPRTQYKVMNKNADFLPATRIAVPVNKENVLRSGIVKPEEANLIEDTIFLNITKGSLDRGEFMLLDLLANFDWKRPLYFTQPYSIEGLGLRDYLQLDGFAFRLVPIKTPYNNDPINNGRVDAEYLYEKLMNEFKYGNIKDPKVYADPTIQTTFNATQVRNVFARLAKVLLEKGDTTRAVEVLDRAIAEVPFEQIYYTYPSTIPLVQAYYMAGENQKANDLLTAYATNLEEHIRYLSQFPKEKATSVNDVFSEKASTLYQLYLLAKTYNQPEIAQKFETYFKSVGLMQ